MLIGWKDQGIAFDLAVHMGTLLAVLLYFRHDVLGLIQDGLTSIRQRRFAGSGQLALCLSSAPFPLR